MRSRHRRGRPLLAALGAAIAVAVSVAGAGSAFAHAQAAEPPVNRRPPQVEGTARVGQILQADRGAWRVDGRALYSYQWRSCDPAGRACADVPGANDRIYAVRPDDAGATVKLAVTAESSSGSRTASSAPTEIVRPPTDGAPVPTTAPAITGRVAPGLTLTVVSGQWTGEQPLRFRYQWRRCNPDGGACEPLASTREMYVVRRSDAERAFRVLVRTQNPVGESASLSDATPPPTLAPRNTSPPVISGVAAQGGTLTASTGSWSGSTPLRFAFQWYRCSGAGRRCSTIPRASAQTYTLARADVGRSVRVRVSARNTAGSSSAVSDHSRVVVGVDAPVNTSLPRISGTAREGGVVAVSPGAWRGTTPITLTYQWLRCGSGGRTCAAIRGATASDRAVDASDVGHTLRVRVTATNEAGASSVLTSPSAVVASRGTAPANTSAPILSGTALEGERLSLSTGTWAGSQPIAFSYRWVRCDTSLRGCSAIDGAGGNGYVLTRADVGKRLYGVVTARNGAGSRSATSNATPVIVGVPVSASPPEITGDVVEGSTLRASTGSWAGVTPMTFGYQWTRCNAQGEFASCVPIVVSSDPTYTLKAADVGRRIFVQVKAQNRFGASYENSVLTPVISAAPIGTVTISPSRTVIVSGQRIVLTGRAVGAPPGQPVTVVERRATADVRVLANAAVTRQGGIWTFAARPGIQTTYQVRVRGVTSTIVSVRVRPRLKLRKIGGNRLSVRVYAARSFAGRIAVLQRWNPRLRRWVAVGRIRLRAIRGVQPLTTGATLHRQVPRGTLVRVVLTGRQAGPGYLTGTSNRVRA